MSMTKVESLPTFLDVCASDAKDDLLDGCLFSQDNDIPGAVLDGAAFSGNVTSAVATTAPTYATLRDEIKIAPTPDAPPLVIVAPQTIEEIVNKRVQRLGRLGRDFSAFLELRGWELDPSMAPWMVQELPSLTDLLILAWIMEYCDEDKDSAGNPRVDDFLPHSTSLIHAALLKLFAIEGGRGHVGWNITEGTGNPAISLRVNKYIRNLRMRKSVAAVGLPLSA